MSLLATPFEKKGYKLYNLETKKFLVSRDVKFSKTIFPFSLAIPTNTSNSHPSVHMHDPDYHTRATHPASLVHEPICSSPTEQVQPSAPYTTISPTLDHVSSTTLDTTSTLAEPSPTDQDIIPDALVPDHTSPTIPSPRRSTRSTKPPAWHKDYHQSNQVTRSTSGSRPALGTRCPFSHFLSYSRFSSAHCSFLATNTGHTEPTSYSQAILDPHWQKAMNAELDAL